MDLQIVILLAFQGSLICCIYTHIYTWMHVQSESFNCDTVKHRRDRLFCVQQFQWGMKAAGLRTEKTALVTSTVQRTQFDKQTIWGSVCLKALILNPHCNKGLTDHELVRYFYLGMFVTPNQYRISPSWHWTMKPKCGSNSENTQIKVELLNRSIHTALPFTNVCVYSRAWRPSSRPNAEPDFNCGRRSLRYGAIALTGIRWRDVMCGHLFLDCSRLGSLAAEDVMRQ